MKPDSPFYDHCRGVLRKSVLFAGLDDSTFQKLLASFRRETWSHGTQLAADLPAIRFTVIISGRVELTRTNPDTGRQITLFTLGAGDAFDVVSLLDKMEHDLCPVALNELEVITAPIEKVRLWIQTTPAFNAAFFPYLGQKIRDLENLTADLALSDTILRLAKLILLLATPAEALFINAPLPLPLVNTLSDEAMARMIGSVRAVVNRHLQEFIKMGLISTSRGELVVRDLEKLKEYCEKALEG